MAKITVDIFDPKSIDKALTEIEVLKTKVRYINEFVSKPLVELGSGVAQRGFDSALSVPQYGNEPVSVSIMETANGYCISAMGNQVTFIEFGAGVYVNGPAYPGNKPEWVVPWGEYGKKHGRQKSWSTPYGPTEGIFARTPMYFALRSMKENVEAVAKRYFEPEEFPFRGMGGDMF